MGESGSWTRDLERALSARIQTLRPVPGGDINEAFEVALSDGRRVFVKAHRTASPRMFEAESDGLRFLREGVLGDSELVIPEVLHVAPRFLVLEYLERTDQDQSEALGRGLARLHAAAADSFGAPKPNFIGTLGQVNEPRETWAAFYRDKRLEVQLSLPGATRLITKEARRRFEILYRHLDELVGEEQPPARLHGDLWGGNSFATSAGPALFDPAAYGGHREVDLAMMKLFGGFSERTFAAYQELYPLAAGAEERVPLYQLYPLLVHVNLFGSSYVGQVEDALRQVT